VNPRLKIILQILALIALGYAVIIAVSFLSNPTAFFE
jgi:hypothetical protein